MKRAEAEARAGEAMRLRRWALGVLAMPHLPADRSPEDVSPRSWELMLRMERCALPLRRRLRARGGGYTVPDGAAEVLDALAIEEMQRILSARAQLQRLSRWAAAHGVAAVILKGAVASLDENHCVNLSDIDVWVPTDAGAALLEALARSGHAAKEHGPARHHHAARLAEQLVSVEVHHAVPHADLDVGWSGRVRPLHSTMPGLARMDAGDHLWHVLVHATIQHEDRRGRLRDLLLLAHARSLCSDDQRHAVLERTRRYPRAEPLLAMLEMAACIASGRALSDAFTHVAASRSLNALVRSPSALQARATAAVLHGPHDARRFLARVFDNRVTPSGRRLLRALQRRSRRFGGAIVLVLRLALHTATLLAVVPRARAARRLARMHDATP